MSKKETAEVVNETAVNEVETAEIVTAEVIEVPKVIGLIKPIDGRRFRLLKMPAQTPRGVQRQIVLRCLLDQNGQPATAKELTPAATTYGLVAVGGIEASVKWHLHQLVKLGLVEQL